MKRLLATFIFLWVSGYAVKAQFLDSIQASLQRKGRFNFNFTSRNSFIDNNDAFIFGISAGVCFDRRISIGGGINFLNTGIFRNDTIEGKVVAKQLHFAFFSYYIEYLFKISKHWEIDVPLFIGLGSSNYTYQSGNTTVTEDNRFVMPIEPSAEVDYDFNKYCGLYVQAGYRWMLVNNHAIHADFNSPTYSFGILIYPFEIYAGLFPKTKLAHLIEDN